MSDPLVLADELGPRGRRRVRIATAISLVLLAALVFVIVRRFQAKGQLDWDRWSMLFSWEKSGHFLFDGLLVTLKAALVAMALALVLGPLGTFGRLSPIPAVRAVATVLVELLRATPLVLMIYFSFVFISRYLFHLSPFWYLVTGLALYNGAVIAEVFRAGISALGRGQREAGLAIGLSEFQVQWRILFPQAVRNMLPALVNQLVTLLKDTSLGAVVLFPPTDDLLSRGRTLGEFYRNQLQTLIVVAAIYIAINYGLSRLARLLQRRRRQTAAAPLATLNPELTGDAAV
jgi:glutamate transport system permease protein